MFLLNIIDPIVEFLPLGAVARLSITCSTMLSILHTQPTNLRIKQLKSSFGEHMNAHRCIECGRLQRTRVCLSCARDDANFRYHPTMAEVCEIIRRHNDGFLPKKRILNARIRPCMLTSDLRCLYRLSDVMELAKCYGPTIAQSTVFLCEDVNAE
jgi:hypothetical protein